MRFTLGDGYIAHSREHPSKLRTLLYMVEYMSHSTKMKEFGGGGGGGGELLKTITQLIFIFLF